MITDKTDDLILVTGGTGYIGSHCCVELLKAGYDIVAIDNLYNSSAEVIPVIESLGGRRINFHQIDLCDASALEEVLRQYDAGSGQSKISAVIHFAGLKAVGESTKKPLDYYSNNIIGSLNLFVAMRTHRINQLVYSSSATVYGDPPIYPIDEQCQVNPTSPYGRSKLFIEKIIEDIGLIEGWRCCILRYFNPVGAHPSGQLGEQPHGTPNNLMPCLARVAVGMSPHITIFGSDYFTRDGTGIRDYIHIVDLCLGHIAALNKLSEMAKPTVQVYNLGTGTGYSVMEMIQAFSNATVNTIPYTIGDRRSGDVATLIADPTKARQELKWTTTKDIYDMCRDLWHWQSTQLNSSSDK